MATCRSSRSSDAERVAKRSVLLGSFGLGGDNGGGDVVGLLLGLDDLDEIGHDLEGRSLTKLDGLHDLNLDSEHTLSEFDVTDGKLLWPSNANYSCFANVPNYERGEQGECQSSDGKGVSDVYCHQGHDGDESRAPGGERKATRGGRAG